MSKKDKDLIGGVCACCGQTQMVEATTEEEANRIATARCRCEEGKKARSAMQCTDNIEEVCGATATNYGMEEIAEDIIDPLRELGSLCVYDYIEAATIRLADSTVIIKQTKDGVAVSRKKALSVKLEA